MYQRKLARFLLVDGKAGHALLEAIVKARIDGKEIPAIPSGTLERPITQWLDWEKENVDYWILSEGMVCYPEYKIDDICYDL